MMEDSMSCNALRKKGVWKKERSLCEEKDHNEKKIII